MKKTIAFLSALVLACTASVSVFAAPAEEPTAGGTVKPNANGAPDPAHPFSNVLFYSDEYYEIIIPASVTLSAAKTVDAEIKADKVMLDNSAIFVDLAGTNDFTVTCGSESFTYSISKGEDTLKAGDTAAIFDQDGSSTETITFSKVDLKDVKAAGQYQGTLTFDISVEPKSVPVQPYT